MDNHTQEITVSEKPFVPTPAQQEKIDTLAKQVDVKNTQQILSFGSEAQQKIAKFSDEMLQNVRTSEAGEISDTLSNLVVQLKGFDADEEKKGFFGLFRSTQRKIESMRVRFDKVEVNVSAVADSLQSHKVQLTSDIQMFDTLFALNQDAFEELNLYIAAGDKEVQRLKDEELAPLTKQAEETKDQAIAQQANDLSAQIERLEKKVHDLRLTRTISIQSAPQIRMLQNADSILAEKIESTIVNTLPLWKSQMTIALGAAHTEGALKAQQAVTDATNELLKKNADALKMNTVKTAEASQRGIVDMDTIRHTNQALIETLDEVRRIEVEGAAKRKAAEKELTQLEGQLRDKLLSYRDAQGQENAAAAAQQPDSFEERVAAATPVNAEAPTAQEAQPEPVATPAQEATQAQPAEDLTLDNDSADDAEKPAE